MQGRYALLVATTEFTSGGLKRLRSPARDIAELGAVLKDPSIGDFEVSQALNQDHHDTMRIIESFFQGRKREDLLLLHISSHGLKADHGDLFFAARNTDRNLPESTAIPATFIHSQMDRCRARSQVLLLDCCYSGAFLQGAKGDPTVHIKDQLIGHGRAILTATNRTEYAWEGENLNELEPAPSHFTGAIVEGLRTGDADRDRDGRVSVQELYDYVYDHVRASTQLQSPQQWSSMQHTVIVARSPFAPEPANEAESNQGESAVTLAPVSPSFQQTTPEVEIDPTTRDSSVARLKRALPDPVRRIEVFDLIDHSVSELINQSDQERRPVYGQVFYAENVIGYRADSDTLLHLVANGVFHDDGRHNALWIRVIERLSRLRDKNLQHFHEDLERLRLYPALLAVYAIGISAVLSRREGLLVECLTIPNWRPPFGGQRRQAPVTYLNPLRVLNSASINDICNPGNGSTYHYPQSHHLHEELREVFLEIEPDGAAYDESFYRFELLASLVAMDGETSLSTPWSGEFLLDSNWGYDDFGMAMEVAQEIGPTWPLLKAGAFGGDQTRAEKAFENLSEHRSRTRHW
ncbi:caspase domain-containing protein [Streptomyces microflavus]|uniref:caspase family protein n=1 Tax=Streptomyces microflavus TaxID=1919 RepID=UPI003243218C